MVTIQPNIPKLSELTHFDVDSLVMGLFLIRLALHARSQSFFQF